MASNTNCPRHRIAYKSFVLLSAVHLDSTASTASADKVDAASIGLDISLLMIHHRRLRAY